MELSERSQKYVTNLKALCNIVRRIAIGAGEITLKHYDRLDELNVETKGDGSPVSLADQEAEEFIRVELEKLVPDIPMIGEESVAQGKAPDIKGSAYFWLVDALDGTKEFISGGEDFTVNIALIHQGAPILGVVYVPVTGVLYAACGERTAIRWSDDTDKEKSIRVRTPPANGLTVVASRSHGSEERMNKLLEEFKVNKIIRRGSSLKICAVAEGRADIYPRLGPTCEWDTAAGDAVMRGAGGMITDLQGQPLKYGGADPKFLNPEFVVCSFDWFNTSEDE